MSMRCLTRYRILGDKLSSTGRSQWTESNLGSIANNRAIAGHSTDSAILLLFVPKRDVIIRHSLDNLNKT